MNKIIQFSDLHTLNYSVKSSVNGVFRFNIKNLNTTQIKLLHSKLGIPFNISRLEQVIANTYADEPIFVRMPGLLHDTHIFRSYDKDITLIDVIFTDSDLNYKPKYEPGSFKYKCLSAISVLV